MIVQSRNEISEAIHRCRAGDRSAYNLIVTTLADRLVALLQKVLGNLEDARDVAQDTFVRAFQNLHRFDPTRPFEPWLYKIGRNLAYNHLQKSARRKPHEQALSRAEAKTETKPPVGAVMEDEQRDQIQRALTELRPEYREILTLRYVAMLDYSEIAERMELPLGTVKTWLNRAKKQFRKTADEGTFF